MTLLFGAGAIALASFSFWLTLYLKGRCFALRDRLCQADAIVVLAGTRGHIKFLHGKIATAVHLYRKGWAPRIICSGKFSLKVTDTPTLIPLSELQIAVAQGRIQEKDIALAAKSWDIALGACYICEQAVQMGVPSEAILVEDVSLHTKENAEMVLALVKKHHMHRIILVTSPFHQRRTYLTFAKVLQPHHVEILNYYADADEWHPATWFLSTEHRKLVRSEEARIKKYRTKGDLL
ncbi:MAG: YdcF family protein [Chloroflexota bacterium]|nr:YdcF family protein [Chloroflexota bacterium]